MRTAFYLSSTYSNGKIGLSKKAEQNPFENETARDTSDHPHTHLVNSKRRVTSRLGVITILSFLLICVSLFVTNT